MNTFRLKSKLDYLLRIGVEIDVRLTAGDVEITARTQGFADKWYGDSKKLTYEELHLCVVGQQNRLETTIDGLAKSVLTAASKANIEVDSGAPHYTLPPGVTLLGDNGAARKPLTGHDVFKGWPK